MPVKFEEEVMPETEEKLVTFESVKSVTTEEYFKGNQFSIDAFNRKYSLEGETYPQTLKRVCDYIASAEKTDELRKYWSERWFDEIWNDWWHPGGSIMQGAGSEKKISLANCTTISLGAIDSDKEWDSLESIIRNTGYSVAKTAAYRQGLGIDFSRIRPKGANVDNSSNISDGATHWMNFIDSLGYFVGQRGRIPAMLFSLNIKHPDILDFISLKKDRTKVQNANISVQITNDFYDAVEKNEDWEMKFIIPAIQKGQKVYVDSQSATNLCEEDENGTYYIATHPKKEEVITHKKNAREILELIAQYMFECAEPGIQNIEIARAYSNSDALYDPKLEYDPRIISTNACSEQYLSRDSLCVLASINMGIFPKNGYKKSLKKISYSINRFLDNVNQKELEDGTFATYHQKLAIKNLRRTGAGVTNISGWLFKQNLEYGSDEGNAAVQQFIEDYNYYLYESTIKLGKEKGNFELFNKEKIRNSLFIQHMEDLGLKFDFMRNVTVSSIAPTGTLSLMFRDTIMSTGIEPPFGLYYWKRSRISGKYEYYFVVPKVVRDFFEEKGYSIPMDSDTIKDTWDGERGRPIAEFIDEHIETIGINFKRDTEINAFDKLKLMELVMKNIDSSISVTYNLPEDTKVSDIADFILKAYKSGVKSVAAFPNQKMYGIVSTTPFKDLAFKMKEEGVQMHPQNFTEEELTALNMTKDHVTFSMAPKRPKKVEADIYTVSIKKEKFIIVIGLLNGTPYEIFGGKMKGLNLKFKYKRGFIEKEKRGIYRIEFDETEIENFSDYFDPTEQAVLRLISTNLRHGVPIHFIVEQLHKAAFDIFSFSAAVARVLKKYIKDGSQAAGLNCPKCQNSALVYRDGCVECSVCNWSKCD